MAAAFSTSLPQITLRGVFARFTSSHAFRPKGVGAGGRDTAAAYCDCASGGKRPQHLDALAAHQWQLQAWAEHCPENFENRAALVDAEIARLEGRELDAERLYEQAIRAARDDGFVHNEAIAYERASDFYRARGFDQIADLYLRNARHAYVRWGADGKVRHLEEMYPHLRAEEPAPVPTCTIATPIAHLDLNANIIGIIIFGLEGQILEANDAFLHIVGYGGEDLASGQLRRTDLTPPEWRDHDARAIEGLLMTRIAQPYEKEYVRKDGGRVPVLIDVARFEKGANQGVAFVLDLTERKRAEAEARESERRYREIQSEFAHANRVATMGQLTASIAHEVSQPIAAAVTNAQAALRWLSAAQPDLAEVRQALTRIVRDGHHAGEVIARIRSLIKKAPQRKDGVAINDAIRQVVALTHGEATKSGVSVRMQLAEGLPLIEGDQVQLQQVILNLVINAIEAMSGTNEAARELLLSSEKVEPDAVHVAVRDSGPGLAPMAMERLFEAFYTTKPNGLGLGLSICRSIIEAHGGRLWATANRLRGAIFQFTVPAQPQAHS